MEKIADNITQLIGMTPMTRLNRYCAAAGVKAEIIAKLESFNPYSVKDRVALAMVEAAEKAGKLREGGIIIEPTSGNTGIGLAMVAAVKGYRLILAMPDTMSAERCLLLRALGAEVLLTDGRDGMRGAIEKARELAQKLPGSFTPFQFENKANPAAHKRTTAKEIWAATDGKLDVVVAGIGSGGTISGVGEALKAKNYKIKIIGVEPGESNVITGGQAGPHGIQGIGAGFVPKNLNQSVIDEVITVSTSEAMTAARLCAKTEGILIGISGGAALCAATKVAQQPNNRAKRIVAIIPDSGERYLSVKGLFDE